MNGTVAIEENVLVSNLKVADSFWLRLKGLLGKKGLKPGEGLLIKPCSQIHTFFMAFPIDVIYLDGEGRILEAVQGMAPGQAGPWVRGCKQVLELPAGTVAFFKIRPQQLLNLEIGQ